jgi:hypothetical protein
MGWAQIMLINKAINNDVTMDAAYIIPAMIIIKAAKDTAALLLYFIEFFKSIGLF